MEEPGGAIASASADALNHSTHVIEPVVAVRHVLVAIVGDLVALRLLRRSSASTSSWCELCRCLLCDGKEVVFIFIITDHDRRSLLPGSGLRRCFGWSLGGNLCSSLLGSTRGGWPAVNLRRSCGGPGVQPLESTVQSQLLRSSRLNDRLLLNAVNHGEVII